MCKAIRDKERKKMCVITMPPSARASACKMPRPTSKYKCNHHLSIANKDRNKQARARCAKPCTAYLAQACIFMAFNTLPEKCTQNLWW